MLADAEMKVAAAVIVAFEIAGALEGEPSLRRWREVGGAPEQPRQTRRDRIQHLRRGVAAGDALRIGGEYWNVSVPPLGEIAPLHALTLIGEFRMGAAVALEQ